MATELVTQLTPADFFRETALGYELARNSATTNTMRGISLQKINPGNASGTPATPWEYLNFLTVIPANLVLATGLTFVLYVTDDGGDTADLGKVIKFGITVKLIAANETTDLSVAAGTEQTGTVTLSSTAGGVAIFTLAIASANLDSAAVGNAIGVRIRRMGADAADTCNGRIILLGGHVKNT